LRHEELVGLARPKTSFRKATIEGPIAPQDGGENSVLSRLISFKFSLAPGRGTASSIKKIKES